MQKYKKGQPWNKAKTSQMLQFEKEKGKNAVYKDKITGNFEFWLWQLEKKRTKTKKQKQTTKLSMTNKEKIKRLEKKIMKLEDEYGKRPSEQYDIGNEIEKLQSQLRKLQISKKPPTPIKRKGKPVTEAMKTQDKLRKINPYAVGKIIEEDDILYFKPAKTGSPFKVVERKLYYGTPIIQLRNLKTGRLSEEPRQEFVYLKSLKDIDKGGKEYDRIVKNPDGKTWDNLTQKRRFLLLDNLGFTIEAKNKFIIVNFRQLPLYVKRQLSFQVNGSNVENVANMDVETFNRRYEKAKDIESREKDNYYCLECKKYHYQIRGKLYKEHKKLAKPGSKKPLLKVHIGTIQLKDLDYRLYKLVREHERGINYYHIKEEIKQNTSLPRKYHPAYIITFYIKKQDKGSWEKHSSMGWMWVPKEHKFIEY